MNLVKKAKGKIVRKQLYNKRNIPSVFFVVVFCLVGFLLLLLGFFCFLSAKDLCIFNSVITIRFCNQRLIDTGLEHTAMFVKSFHTNQDTCIIIKYKTFFRYKTYGFTRIIRKPGLKDTDIYELLIYVSISLNAQ